VSNTPCYPLALHGWDFILLFRYMLSISVTCTEVELLEVVSGYEGDKLFLYSLSQCWYNRLQTHLMKSSDLGYLIPIRPKDK